MNISKDYFVENIIRGDSNRSFNFHSIVQIKFPARQPRPLFHKEGFYQIRLIYLKACVYNGKNYNRSNHMEIINQIVNTHNFR